jgi:hypothetical protein
VAVRAREHRQGHDITGEKCAFTRSSGRAAICPVLKPAASGRPGPSTTKRLRP